MILFPEWRQPELPVRRQVVAAPPLGQERPHPVHLLPPAVQRHRQLAFKSKAEYLLVD